MERIGNSPAWQLSLGRCYAWVRPGEWKQYLLIMARIYALVTLSFALGRSTRQRVFGARPGGSSTIAPSFGVRPSGSDTIVALAQLCQPRGGRSIGRCFGARPEGSGTIARAAQARRAENPIERFVVIGMGNLRNVLFIVGDANGCDPLR